MSEAGKQSCITMPAALPPQSLWTTAGLDMPEAGKPSGQGLGNFGCILDLGMAEAGEQSCTLGQGKCDTEDLKHLPNVETRFYCPQTFLSLDF